MVANAAASASPAAVLEKSPPEREATLPLRCAGEKRPPGSQVVSCEVEPEPATGELLPPERGSFRPQTPSKTTRQGGEPTPVSVEVTVGLSLMVTDRPAGNVGGRPRKLDDTARAQVTALLATGLSLRHAAAVLGLSHSTICEAITADPQFCEEVSQARLRAEILPLQTMVRESRRSWRAATWLMQHLQRQRNLDRTLEERVADDRHEMPARLMSTSAGREMAAVAVQERRRKLERRTPPQPSR